MIDTIKAKLITNEEPSIDRGYFRYGKKIDGGMEYVYQIENIRVKVRVFQFNNIIQLNGSLHKFLHGTNLTRFTHQDVKKALEKLTDILGLDVGMATLKRIDIGANLAMEKPVVAYTSLLVDKKRFLKDSLSNGQSIYFKIGRTSLLFYDKKSEFKKKAFKEQKDHYSSFIKDLHLLRYELKLEKRLASALKLEQMHLYDLCSATVYKRLIDLWYNEYLSINKTRNHLNNAKEFKNIIFNRGIKEGGGLSKTLDDLYAWCTMYGHTATKKSRIKKWLIKTNIADSEINKFQIELDQKIKFEKECYL